MSVKFLFGEGHAHLNSLHVACISSIPENAVFEIKNLKKDYQSCQIKPYSRYRNSRNILVTADM